VLPAGDRQQVEESIGRFGDVFQIQEVGMCHNPHETASFFRHRDFLGRSIAAAHHQDHRAILFFGVVHRPV
jgi:hypothetical protein